MPNAPFLGGACSAKITGVFLRRKTKQHLGVYSYWRLCDAVRSARWPRQRVVASLCKLDQEEVVELKGGSDDLLTLLRGDTPSARTTTSPLPWVASDEPGAARWEQVGVRGKCVERTCDFGEGYLGLAIWNRLKIALRRAVP